jgi:hypothetical protein
MPRKSSVIDHLDLEIEIPEISLERFNRWLDDFVENHTHVEVKPKIKNSILLMNSNDLVAFMGYIDQEEISQIELYRFRSHVVRELERNLLKAVSLDSRSHYQWCLAALKNFELGRFREED